MGKESACHAGVIGDLSLIPESGRSAGGGNGNLLQHSCLKIPMDRGACQTAVHGFTKSQTQRGRRLGATMEERDLVLVVPGTHVCCYLFHFPALLNMGNFVELQYPSHTMKLKVICKVIIIYIQALRYRKHGIKF